MEPVKIVNDNSEYVPVSWRDEYGICDGCAAEHNVKLCHRLPECFDIIWVRAS